MFFALLVGIPAGILLSRPAARGVAEYVMQIFNVGNTLPPLAVLALAMVVIGIGDTPAIIALFLCLAAADCAQYLRRAVLGAVVVTGSGKRNWDDQMAASAPVELPNARPVMLSASASPPPLM